MLIPDIGTPNEGVIDALAALHYDDEDGVERRYGEPYAIIIYSIIIKYFDAEDITVDNIYKRYHDVFGGHTLFEYQDRSDDIFDELMNGPFANTNIVEGSLKARSDAVLNSADNLPNWEGTPKELVEKYMVGGTKSGKDSATHSDPAPLDDFFYAKDEVEEVEEDNKIDRPVNEDDIDAIMARIKKYMIDTGRIEGSILTEMVACQLGKHEGFNVIDEDDDGDGFHDDECSIDTEPFDDSKPIDNGLLCDEAVKILEEKTGVNKNFDPSEDMFAIPPSHKAVAILNKHGLIREENDPAREYDTFFKGGTKTPEDYYNILDEVTNEINVSWWVQDVKEAKSEAERLLLESNYPSRYIDWDANFISRVRRIQDEREAKVIHEQILEQDTLRGRDVSEWADIIDEATSQYPSTEQVFDRDVVMLQAKLMSVVAEFIAGNTKMGSDHAQNTIRYALKNVEKSLMTTIETGSGLTLMDIS